MFVCRAWMILFGDPLPLFGDNISILCIVNALSQCLLYIRINGVCLTPRLTFSSILIWVLVNWQCKYLCFHDQSFVFTSITSVLNCTQTIKCWGINNTVQLLLTQSKLLRDMEQDKELKKREQNGKVQNTLGTEKVLQWKSSN